MSKFLLDTNLLLRFSDLQSPAHQTAITAISRLLRQSYALYITPQNLIEFWAVATRPRAANGFDWSIEQTQTEISELINRFRLLVDSPNVFTQWLRLVQTHNIKGKKTHDARLVAIMLTHQISNLLTFNTDDFRSYQEINVYHPSEILQN